MIELNIILALVYLALNWDEDCYLVTKIGEIDQLIFRILGVIGYAAVFGLLILSEGFGSIVLGVLLYDSIINTRRML